MIRYIVRKEDCNDLNKRLPNARAFVDYEHWYISLERGYGVKPDVKSWHNELNKMFNLQELVFFADFSNVGLRAELDKLRNETKMIIDTQNPSAYYKKDFTDFIMLDYIYQSAMTEKKTDVFVIFTGDGHFSSVVRFLTGKCKKKVFIYGVTNAVSSQLKSAATYTREVPTDTDVYREYYRMIIDQMNYLYVHRELTDSATEQKITADAARKNYIEPKLLTGAFRKLVDDGYIYLAPAEAGNKKTYKANWELLKRDNLWQT